jgi:uncharacterized membrane-anchored protein YitT (DUF2179 family)
MGQNKSDILLKQFLPILVGTAIYAFGLHYFVVPNELMEGGITGIALLLNYSMNVPPSYTTLILNIPLFYLGWRIFGRKPMYYTLLGILSLSFFLWIMELLISYEWLSPFRSEQDYLLAALYAGLTLGTGLGIVFRFGGTTGGTDIIARVGNKIKGWSMGQTILIMDTIVIGVSLFYISREKVLYTLVLVFIASRMIDIIQKGTYAAKAFTIITEESEKITAMIYKEMDRGVTLFTAKGAFSKKQKEVIYCVVYRHETRRLTSLVRQNDPKAFIVIGDVQDVLGEGFKID